ncbi:lipoprotein [Spiroplasma endosymbiont of Polydrusus formosus]|uniref:lipoprotein n=1 Tax=Spiroplasma endosymbiont of Polydrusus formosus TaxID=3139326 RepID=UPI0035B531EB
MKKILGILGTITLIGTSTTSLIACNTSLYSEKQLKELKEKNNIKTKDGILEWIAPEEKPFNQIDNKWYFVVWCGDNNSDWRIVKFKNNIDLNIPAGKRNLDNLSGYNLNLTNSGIKGINLNIYKSAIVAFSHWWDRSDDYFKSVYLWNNDSEPNIGVKNKLKSYLNL